MALNFWLLFSVGPAGFGFANFAEYTFTIGLVVYVAGRIAFARVGHFGSWHFDQECMSLRFDGIPYEVIPYSQIEDVGEHSDTIKVRHKTRQVITIPLAAFASEEAKQQVFNWITESRMQKSVATKASV
ncbi:hypothetical protein BH11ARM1_BH11ARM1_01120 [soil metagenome]